MSRALLHYVCAGFFLYLIAELYWLNDGENYWTGFWLNIALLVFVGGVIVFDWIKSWIKHEQHIKMLDLIIEAELESAKEAEARREYFEDLRIRMEEDGDPDAADRYIEEQHEKQMEESS